MTPDEGQRLHCSTVLLEALLQGFTRSKWNNGIVLSLGEEDGHLGLLGYPAWMGIATAADQTSQG